MADTGALRCTPPSDPANGTAEREHAAVGADEPVAAVRSRGDPDDRRVEHDAAERTGEVRGAEREDAAVRRGEQVAVAVGRGGDAD